MKPDLTLLYSELGLRPDCTLAELQLAYRRQIAELHPHGASTSHQSAESAAALRDLIALYTTASRFHRRYGRLPGAPPHRGGGAQRALAVASGANPDRLPVPMEHHDEPHGTRITLGVAVVFLVLVFGVLALVSGEWLR